MKKVLMSIGAVALMFAATSCEPENQGGGVDFDEITLDGFIKVYAATLVLGFTRCCSKHQCNSTNTHQYFFHNN